MDTHTVQEEKGTSTFIPQTALLQNSFILSVRVNDVVEFTVPQSTSKSIGTKPKELIFENEDAQLFHLKIKC